MIANSIESEYDCVVIGGGPAGCTAAALVAEQGWRTLLVERDALPRFHVGESLMPETYGTLDRLGIIDKLKVSSFSRKIGVQFVDDSGRQSQPFFFRQHDERECAETWHVERSHFDKLLFDNAREKGASCLDRTRVLRLEINDHSPHYVHLRTGDNEPERLRARVIVDATGQQALIANQLKLRTVNPDLRKAAIWGHFQVDPRSDESNEFVTSILHTVGKGAWFWHIPLARDRVSVGLVSDNDYLLRGRGQPESVFHEELAACPGLQKLLPGAQQIGKLHVAKEFSYTTSKHAGDGWVLVGDAFGFLDPIYSTGVFLALKSGELAADAIGEALSSGETSAQTLGRWTDEFKQGVQLFRKLVEAFYTNEFSFASFLKKHPEHQGNLTDLLIGRAFYPGSERIFEDLDPALEMARRTSGSGEKAAG